MSQKEKILQKIENNPHNVSFEDIKKLLEWFDYQCVHIKGSHHKFKKGSKSIVLPYHKPIKSIYVKQILSFIKEQ